MAADLVNSIRSTIGVQLTVVVSLTWSASFVAGFFTHDYTPLGITTPVMLVVVGAVLATRNHNERKQ
jgi:hypothetical protein